MNCKRKKNIETFLVIMLTLVLVSPCCHSGCHQNYHHRCDHQNYPQYHCGQRQYPHNCDDMYDSSQNNFNHHERIRQRQHPHEYGSLYEPPQVSFNDHSYHNYDFKPSSQFKMIENQAHLIQSLKLTPISIFFYGQTNTRQYQQFQNMLPAYNSQFQDRLSTEVEFYFIPSQKFTLRRPKNSLSIFRKINNGEWLMYKGRFQKYEMTDWILKNTIDPLNELTGHQVYSLFAESKRGFILLDYGQFCLLKTKIMLTDFCRKYDLFCGKVTPQNKAIAIAIQLMRAQKQPGVSKLGFWDPKTQQLKIYTKDPAHITQNELMQLYSGHESILPYETQLDVAKSIHTQTQFIQIKQYRQNLEL